MKKEDESEIDKLDRVIGKFLWNLLFLDTTGEGFLRYLPMVNTFLIAVILFLIILILRGK